MYKYNLGLIFIVILFSCKSINNSTIRPNKAMLNDTEATNIFTPLKSFDGDTLNYLKYNFIKNKHLYINKPLKLMLNSLELPIYKYYNGSPYSYDDKTNDVPDFYLNIYPDVAERQKKHMNPAILLIAFSKTIPADSAYGLVKTTQLKWTKDAIDFYSHRIVKNIQMVDSL